MPLVHDGVYKIHNFKYSHTKELKDQQVADLVNGGPGPIDGRRDYLAHNDQVRVILCRGLLHSPVL